MADSQQVQASHAPLHVTPQPFQVVGRAGTCPRVGSSHDLSPSFASRQRRAVHHAFAFGGAAAHATAFAAAAAAAAAAIAGLLRRGAKKLSRQARTRTGPTLAHAPHAAARLRCATASRGHPRAAWRSATRRACAESKLSSTPAGGLAKQARTAPPASRTRCRCCPGAARRLCAPTRPARRCSAAKQPDLCQKQPVCQKQP